MEFSLPPEIAEGSSLRGNEYGWQISTFPEALYRAKSQGFACLGGQFQFRLPDGIYEMYWLNADSTKRNKGEAWRDYSGRSCSEVLKEFNDLVSRVDFAKEAENLQLDTVVVKNLVFVANFVTELEFCRTLGSAR
jgi:hypothetical protein